MPRRKGHRIGTFCPSAKASTLLNVFRYRCAADQFVVDRSHLKQRRFMSGIICPMLLPKALLEGRLGYILVPAWNFAGEILGQRREFRRAGGKFIVPVAEVTVIQTASHDGKSTPNARAGEFRNAMVMRQVRQSAHLRERAVSKEAN